PQGNGGGCCPGGPPPTSRSPPSSSASFGPGLCADHPAGGLPPPHVTRATASPFCEASLPCEGHCEHLAFLFAPYCRNCFLYAFQVISGALETISSKRPLRPESQGCVLLTPFI